MQFKHLDDLAALQRCGSFVRAAEARHVTHPAFGRRIRALEAWAGVPLVDRSGAVVRLHPAGLDLLQDALPLLAAVQQRRSAWQTRGRAGADPAADTGVHTLRLGTGRTLARTLVADWLARLRAPLRRHRVELHTGAMAEVARRLESGEVDMVCCYEHPALSIGLSGQRFRHATLAHDRLVPVARLAAAGTPRFKLAGAPLIAYAPSMSLGRLLADHLRQSGDSQAPQEYAPVVCDSADAMHELVRKGLGVAWLPWSLVAGDCRRKVLSVLGGRADEVHFDVRLYRPRARQNEAVEAAWTASLK